MSKNQPKTPTNTKMPYKEFVERSIKSLRVAPHKGIHVVFSNFNEAFRQYYNEEPRPIIDKLVEEGFLASRPARGGAMIMLVSDLVSDNDQKPGNSASATLAKILSSQS